MKVIIKRNGMNYTVGFETGAVRHFYGTEEEFQVWVSRKCAEMTQKK